MKSENLKDATIVNNMEIVKFVATHLKGIELDKITEDDVFTFNNALANWTKPPHGWKSSQNAKPVPVSNTTKGQYKLGLRRFLLTYGERQKKPELVELGKSISLKNMPGADPKKSSDMLSFEEIKQIINAALTIRDKAIIATMYESGGRNGEISTMKLKDVDFNEHGCKIKLKGKTGVRFNQLVFAASYLHQWISIHPLQHVPDVNLWVSTRQYADQESNTGKNIEITNKAISGLLARAVKAAGIKKRVHPHLLRHSRVTHLSSEFTEPQLKKFFGWSSKSMMPATYIHMDDQEIDNSVLKIYGLSKTRNINCIDIVSCPRCKMPVEADTQFCGRCGMPLAKEAQVSLDATAEKLLDYFKQHPEIFALINKQS